MWTIERQGNAFGLYDNDIFRGRLYGDEQECNEVARKLTLASFSDEGMIQGAFHLSETSCIVSLISVENQHILWESIEFPPQKLDVLQALGKSVLEYLIRVLRGWK